MAALSEDRRSSDEGAPAFNNVVRDFFSDFARIAILRQASRI
jgi:hypothetical protein